MQEAGVKVLRTWVRASSRFTVVLDSDILKCIQGFNAINGSELAGAEQSGLTYYQVWNSSEWTLNDGPQGLQRLDHVIEMAAKHDIKVILTFTNNWYFSPNYFS
jgi:mannan endo-1,4-beta-mannosidase